MSGEQTPRPVVLGADEIQHAVVDGDLIVAGPTSDRDHCERMAALWNAKSDGRAALVFSRTVSAWVSDDAPAVDDRQAPDAASEQS